MNTPAPGQAAQALALLDEVLDDVEHVVDGNPDWIDRDMLTAYSERAAAIAALRAVGDYAAALAAREPHAVPPVYVCPDCGAEDDDEAVIARHMASEHAAPAPDLAAAMARVRRVLENSPTASIARREALEIINAFGVQL